MKKLLVIAILAIFSTLTLNAQISFYKIENNTKTLIPEGTDIVIPIDDNMRPQFNILVEVDLKLFRAKYKYDNLYTSYNQTKGDEEYPFGYVTFDFDSPMNKKKYVGETALRMYLFQTPEGKRDVKSHFMLESVIPVSQVTLPCEIVIEGSYITGQEEYITEERTLAKKNTYSEGDILSTLHIKYSTSAKTMVDVKYYKYIKSGDSDDEMEGIKRISGFTSTETERYYNMPRKGVDTYPVLYAAFKDIYTFRKKEIVEEKDMQKALDLLKKWNNDYKIILVAEKDQETLKALNRELKPAKTIEEKFAVFKKYNPKS